MKTPDEIAALAAEKQRLNLALIQAEKAIPDEHRWAINAEIRVATYRHDAHVAKDVELERLYASIGTAFCEFGERDAGMRAYYDALSKWCDAHLEHKAAVAEGGAS